MSLNIHTLEAQIDLRVAKQDLQQLTVARPDEVARQLAEAVVQACQLEGLDYFPALTHFEQDQRLDNELLEAAHALVWLASQRARSLIMTRLRPIFSSVRVQQINARLYTLPRARPGQPNLPSILREHYDPAALRVNLQLSMIQKRPAETEALESYARKMLWKWLKDHFDRFEVALVRRQE